MSLTFKCIYCGKDITVESSQIHETVECEQCHSKVEVSDTATQGNEEATSSNPSPKISKETTVTKADMKKSLRIWGIGLIVLGVIHLLAASFLDPVWGGMIIVIGILNLCIRHRGMFVVNGAALILVGILNITGSLIEGGVGWIIFGALQLWWGATEIRKFAKYAPLYKPQAASQPVGSATSQKKT